MAATPPPSAPAHTDPTPPPAAPAWLPPWAASQGATLEHDEYGWNLDWAGSSVLPQSDFIALLPDWGVLQAQGADARRFLHSQLTQDITHLEPGQARWAGYCSAKGRLLGTLRGWSADSAVLLLTAQPMAAALVRRLRMFVLRAQVQVQDGSADWVVLGLGGASVAALAAQRMGLALPEADGASSGPDAHLVGLPTCAALGQRPRYQLLVRPQQLPALWAELQSVATPVASATWRYTEVVCGVPRIVPATSEQFVPQMLNFELVGGVNFKKGCYPGQEVVARTQYLGKLKRRMMLARGAGAAPAPGTDILAADRDEPCGLIVMAANDGQAGFVALLETQQAALEAGPLRVADGVLTPLDLPYPLTAPE